MKVTSQRGRAFTKTFLRLTQEQLPADPQSKRFLLQNPSTPAVCFHRRSLLLQRCASDSQNKRGKAIPRSGRRVRGAPNSLKLTPDNWIRKSRRLSSSPSREGTLCRPRGWLCSRPWENSSVRSTPSAGGVVLGGG